MEKMQKEIHDAKMKRFIEHTQVLSQACPEKAQQPRREQKRVDTRLREENKQIDLDYRVSISPSRKRSKSRGFTVKPTQVNHFTGKKLTVDDTRTVELEVKREDVQGGYKKTPTDDDDELYVQVGEHT